MSELKPCPFCGNTPMLRNDAGEWRVECSGPECDCLPSTWWYESEEEAIEAWNRRAEA